MSGIRLDILFYSYRRFSTSMNINQKKVFSMLKKVLTGYKKSFFSFVKIFIIVALCMTLAFAIVFPLWKFATSLPKVYTYCILTFLALAAIFLIAKAIKKNSLKTVLLTFLNILIITIGSVLCVFFVFIGYRFYALISLAVFLVIKGLLRFGIKDK